MGTKTQKLSNVVDQIVEWQSVVTADGSTGLTAVAGRGYFIDTTSGAITVTLPASPKAGDVVQIADYAGTFGTNSVTINPNGGKIQNSTVNGFLSVNNTTVSFVYMDSTKGWKQYNLDTATPVNTPLYVAATGGTVTTSGDYKIHTFTGDGCFVVSCGGNSIGSNSVDYLVVAGGGGGGGNTGPAWGGASGGGAGGYRESSGAASGCYTISPLGACVAALPVSATTYPVTVGGGGAGGPGPSGTSNGNGARGSNSVFSTITSTGGGGGRGSTPGRPSADWPGGSGGGGVGGSIGSGNTPPVSPPQGNPGGAGVENTPAYAQGGGGGATAAGSGGPPAAEGRPGGAGATSSINGTPTARAGGGGSGGAQSNPGGTGGTGGGAPGATGPASGPNATANTGGGGGGSAANADESHNGGAGGKGIVIIRYKYQ